MSVRLYEHNKKAYDAALAMLKEKGRAAVIHPTGTGKSMLGFQLAEEHKPERVLWLSPSDYIFRTQLENLKAESGQKTLPENITFLTYAKLMWMDRDIIAELKPDWIILDEFHRCGAAEWGRGVETLLAGYPTVPVFGLSATNIRYLDQQRDMAEELFDGNIASEITLGEAIAKGILQAPVYVTSVYSYQKELDRYQKKISKLSNPGVREINRQHLEELRRALDMADGLEEIFSRYMKKKDGRYLVFCAGKEHMEEMKGHVPEWFGKLDEAPHVYSMYAEDPESEKEFTRFLADQSPHLKLLFCIDMLNEGIHIRDVSGVILFRPTVSPIIYKQQIGRALSAGSIGQPVIFDIVNNFDNLYSIQALEQEFETAIRYYGERDGHIAGVKEQFHIFDEVKECRRLFCELQKSLSSPWEIYYDAAKQYYDVHKNLEVPKRYKSEDGLCLGAWLCVQRQIYSGKAQGSLTEAQVKRLSAIGMVWDNRLELAWEKNYEAARRYFERHKNLDVKTDYVTEDGIHLGAWLVNQRRQRANGARGSLLTEERAARLSAIGMVWDKFSYLWEKNYEAAAAYYRKHEDLVVPFSFVTEDGIRLGEWIHKLRGIRSGRIQNGRLTEEQIARLDAIGMVWKEKREADLERCLKAAQLYYEAHGSLDVPAAYVAENGAALGRWLGRIKKSPEKLSREQRAFLTSLGMQWKETDPWEERYSLAKQYFEEHGNLDIPQEYVTEDGIWLGKWIYLQRMAKQRREDAGWQYRQSAEASTEDCREPDELTEERIKRLDAIGMIWKNRRAQKWDSAYERAKEYYRAHGNLNLPAAYRTGDGYVLGRWVREQKKKYHCGRLSAEQVQRLEEVGVL